MKMTVAELRAKSHGVHRNVQSEQQLAEYTKLVKAHQNLVHVLMGAICRSVEEAIMHDPGETRTFVANPHKGADLCGNTLEYVLHGYYNMRKEEWSRRVHHFAGLWMTPLEEVQHLLRPHGIDWVEDITDPEKNCDLLLKVSFGLKGPFNES